MCCKNWPPVQMLGIRLDGFNSLGIDWEVQEQQV
jgi:hypothetical protein